jgi:predicted dehydrogenase
MLTSVGLAGTGFWAETVHGPSIADSPWVEFAGIWGRNAAARDRLASALGVRAFASFEDLQAAVDVVDLSVAPPTQAGLAVAAAEAGKHLLLEKPIALSLSDAVRLNDAVLASGVAAVVFIPRFFDASRVAWLNAQVGAGHTRGIASWFTDSLTPGSPYFRSDWRRESGGLWDVAPHLLSQVIPVLGPVRSVRVLTHDHAGVTHLALVHAEGGESLIQIEVNGALGSEKRFAFEFSGPHGVSRAPSEPLDYVAGHRMALAELVRQIGSGRPASDAWFSIPASVEITRVLDAVESAIKAGSIGVQIPVTPAGPAGPPEGQLRASPAPREQPPS